MAVVSDRETMSPVEGASHASESIRVTDIYDWHDRWYMVARHQSLLAGTNNK